ncbi:MAG: hypothetical protein L6R38_000134 [Xanthoria sp. 2 TBL-2021]|nr:MAG: hypothetical protein L6R38_000134 [Xanthoria sp. 2 TBL-2021]
MDRKADPETQLEVDEAILDYLIYTAIISLLKLLDTIDISPRQEHNTHLLVQMVDTFLPVFRALHTNYKASPEIQLRLRLLQFTYVFVHHYYPFRANNSFSRRPSISTENPKDPRSGNPHQEHPQAMSLEQTLPLFLALSAVQNELQGSTITEIWMMLAAGYMAQAYIEQVVVYQNQRPGLLEEAFHWGYDVDCRAEEATEQWQINDMFGADESSVRLWQSIREEHVQALHPPEKTSLVDHLEDMASGALSVVTFKEKVSEFLAGLLSAYQPPLLIQLERGEVEGLSRKATKALKIRSGFIHQAIDET